MSFTSVAIAAVFADLRFLAVGVECVQLILVGHTLQYTTYMFAL